MYGITYNGSRKGESDDDLVIYIQADPRKIKYPIRKATVLEQYFNTTVQRFIQYLREKGHNSPRNLKYISEAHNNADRNKTKQNYSFNGITRLGKTNSSLCIR